MNRLDKIKHAEQLINSGCSNELKAVLERDFPELKESEDEKIRNEILEYFLITRIQDFIAKPERQKWISYIEKQKKQKPAECIEFDNEFKNQVSHLLASVLNKEWEYNKSFVEYATQQLLGYAKHEIKAEWMAGQGETVEGYIAGINEVAAILAIPRKEHNKGDKVVVQIRKK